MTDLTAGLLLNLGPPEAAARWLSERKGEPVRFEKVEPGDEQILEQRDLDSLPSALDRED